MILASMQPYFFPYLGYFDLIFNCDQWIVFDTVQYIRHGWINRNRILHPTDGWQYIIVPIKKHAFLTTIKEIEIDQSSNWAERIIGQLQHYRKKAPYFLETITLVEKCLDIKETKISRLNVEILDKVCRNLGIDFRYEYFSEMNLNIDSVDHPGQWALRMSESIGADEYINAPGGVNLYNPEEFKRKGIKLSFRNLPDFVYSCPSYKFHENLSIIDVMMWNRTEEIIGYLEANKK
jgi:hypothetical protein